jgi:hypothetical protein
MPKEFDERSDFIVDLRFLDRPEERNRLIAADRYPREPCGQQCMIHEESAETSIAVHEGMNGDELKVHQ